MIDLLFRLFLALCAMLLILPMLALAFGAIVIISKFRNVVAVTACAVSITACDGSGPTGPTEQPTMALPTIQLQAPSKLKGQWATATEAPYMPGNHNVVVLLINYARDDPKETARLLAERRLPVIVYAGHIYSQSPEKWAASWAYFDTYLEPFKAAGVLVGIQPVDEPRHQGTGAFPYPDRANADAKARGYRVLATEWADQVWGPWFNTRPAGVDWWAITCYPFPGTKWTAERCGERLRDYPSVDTLAVISGHGYDPQPWISVAEARGRGWLIWEEQ